MSLTRENYFDYGTGGDDIIVSNSSLSYINPNEGGSIKRFMNYIRGKTEKEESKSLERGRLLHRFLEDSESFTMLPDDLPSDDVCRIVEDVRAEVVASGLAPGLLQDNEAAIVQVARQRKFGAANWSSETIIKRIRAKGDAYWTHLCNTDGKVMTDAKTRLILDSITDGLKSNPYTWDNYIQTPPGVMKEFPILFEMLDFTCKALLDNVYVDFDKKEGTIRDVKTTSKPVSTYLGRYEVKAPDKREFVYGPFVWYHTYRQLAFYEWAVKKWLTSQGELGHKYHFKHEVLACETIEPYEHIVYIINPEWIRTGVIEFEECFAILKSELAHGNETFNNRATEQRV